MIQYYKNITSPRGAKVRFTRRYTNMNSTKGAHELQQKISRVEQEGMEEKTTDIPPC